MNKKGITFGYLIAAIIAIIILVVLIWIFRESITASLGPWFTIIKGVESSGEGVGESIANLA